MNKVSGDREVSTSRNIVENNTVSTDLVAAVNNFNVESIGG